MLSVRCVSVCPVCDVGVLWPNGWTDQDQTWHAGRPRTWSRCVRWRTSSPSSKRAHPRQLLAHICCGQVAGWTKMPLGMKVDLGPCDFVLDGDPAPLTKRGRNPLPKNGPCLLWPNGWIYRDGTWYGGRPQLRRVCVRWGTCSPSPKVSVAPNFTPRSVVAKRLDGPR